MGARWAAAALVLSIAGGVAADDLMAAHARWLEGRPELRDGVPHSTWRSDPDEAFALHAGCPERLESIGVGARPLGFAPTAAPEPVVLTGPVGGVHFVKRRRDSPFVVACALAERLPRLAAVFAEHGVHTVVVSSALRREPVVSFHHLGLALDVIAVEGTRDGAPFRWEVARDYVGDPNAPTCASFDRRTDPWRALLCDLHERAGLHTCIGPDYGRGHAGHLHLDLRPGDPRRFIR